jgi:hypothetical protein
MVAVPSTMRVWVDAKGMVSRAVVEDADDKESAEAGYARATLLSYVPYVEDGHPATFETSYFMRSMGGGGGMRLGRGGMGAPGGEGGGDAPGTTPGAPPSGGSGGPGGM